MADFLFYLFSAIVLFTAAAVVVSKNAVNSAMFFLMSLMATAALFVLLDAYLLAVLLVLVYAGAVVALFLFIVMLLDMQGGTRPPFQRSTLIAGTVAGMLLTLGVLSLWKRGEISAAPVAADVPALGATLKLYAAQLFTTYLLPVQVVGFLLLIAMLGVIVLSKRFEGLDDIK